METMESRPIPDPTERTLDQSRREISMLRELLESRMGGAESSAQLLREFNTAIAAHLRVEISALKELEEEKFKGINGQFAQRDVALSAALQAQKEAAAAQQVANSEAIQKSEAATKKQMDQTGETVKTVEKTMGDKIDDLKDRVSAIESFKKGGSEVWGVVMGVIGIVALIAAVVVEAVRH
jgi:hypothetical protein